MYQFCLQNTGWWTYEYCHGDYIRQYHSEGTTCTVYYVSCDYKLTSCVITAAKTVKNLWIGYYQNETVWTQEEISKAKVSSSPS